MAGETCAALVAALNVLQSADIPFVLVHESALMGWGIDYSAFLSYVDALLLYDESFGELGLIAPANVGEFREMELGGTPARLWSRASLGLSGAIEETSSPRYGCEALAPEAVLRKLSYSPDFPMLAEQRARLAAILHAESLTDDELSLVAHYVRGE